MNFVKVSGPWACFTRPETVEGVSYEVMTPSAGRGLLECVYWKPEMRWVVDGIYVLKPVQFMSIMRNCIKDVIIGNSPVDVTALKDQGDMRDQRNATILVDVEYVIKAHIEAEDSAKHVSIFRRRMEKGQFFRHPYLGCREFGVDLLCLVDNAPEIPPALKVNKNLGVMLHSIDYANHERPLFFDAEFKNGYLEVPPVEDKRRVR